MIKKLFQIKEQTFLTSLAVLFIRYVFGSAMVYHGWGKIQNPFAWMPTDGPMQVPAVFQFLAAVSEVGGGIAIILGMVFPLANLGVAFTMIVAMYLHMIILKQPFIAKAGGSYELAAVFFALSVLLMATGPGRFSVDRLIFGIKGEVTNNKTGE